MFLLQLMDSYVSSWCVFLMAALECAIIGWIYGKLCVHSTFNFV